MAQSKYGEFFLYEKEGEDDQGKIDTKYGYTLNDFSVRSLFEDNGDTGDAAGCEVVRRNEGIGGNREQERGKSENKSRFYDVDEFDFPIALGQNSLFCPHALGRKGDSVMIIGFVRSLARSCLFGCLFLFLFLIHS